MAHRVELNHWLTPAQMDQGEERAEDKHRKTSVAGCPAGSIYQYWINLMTAFSSLFKLILILWAMVNGFSALCIKPKNLMI